jgi:hypothetical protein
MASRQRPPPQPRRRATPRAQVKKEEEELQRAFGASGVAVMGVQKPGAPRPGATAADLAETEKKMVTVMLFGNAHECEVAQRMIGEAIDNKARARPNPSVNLRASTRPGTRCLWRGSACPASLRRRGARRHWLPTAAPAPARRASGWEVASCGRKAASSGDLRIMRTFYRRKTSMS